MESQRNEVFEQEIQKLKAEKVERDRTVELRELKIKELNEKERRAIEAIRSLWSFIQLSRVQNEKVLERCEDLKYRLEKNNLHIVIGKQAPLQPFLQDSINRILQLFQILLPENKLWAAFRQRRYGKLVYKTVVRAGDHHPNRDNCTEDIPEGRSIPNMLHDEYNKTGFPVIITNPDDQNYDPVEGDKFQENNSILAAGIIINTRKGSGDIYAEMPLWFVVNSPEKNVFFEELKFYALCCACYLSELASTWPDELRVT
ncbi:MAG: hypothetical protein ACYSSI_03015 [Planctomycetota bacterium]|jgi:hypothetical protein